MLVDVEEYYYACPHCGGNIIVRVQTNREGANSHIIRHKEPDESYGEEMKLEYVV